MSVDIQMLWNIDIKQLDHDFIDTHGKRTICFHAKKYIESKRPYKKPLVFGQNLAKV